MTIQGSTDSSNIGQIPELQKLRVEAASRLKSLKFPDSRDEMWRYTTPNQIPFDLLNIPGAKISPTLAIWRVENSVELPDGVAWLSGSDVSSKLSHRLSEISAWDQKSGDAVSALFLSSASSVNALSVKRGVNVQQPLLLSQLAVEESSNCFAPLIIVDVEPQASVTVIDDLSSANDGFEKGLIAPRIEIFAGAGTKVNFISLVRAAAGVKVLGRHCFHLSRDSQFSSAHVALSGDVSRIDIDVALNEPGANASLIGISLADQNRHIDFHTTQWHNAPNCRSDLFFKGVVKDKARSVYYGYIRVAEGAQRTDAYQTNRTLLLSPAARADAIPNLEIKANDVKCSHGASVSHVNQEELFYLMTRGLSRSSAEQIIIEGFLEDLIGRLDNSEIHQWLSSQVLGRLGSGTPNR